MTLDWKTFTTCSPYPLSNEQVAQFKTLHKLLTEWNQQSNLTRLTSEPDYLSGHVLDSLTLAPFLSNLSKLPKTEQISLLDIGSGAGFPSIPIAIVFPNILVKALDATQKKTAFMQHIKEALQLSNLTVLTGRAETLGHDTMYREQFDVVTARAVAALPTLIELSLPFVKLQGHFIAMKTPQALEQEVSGLITASKILGIDSDFKIHDVSIPDYLPARNLLQLKKISTTPLLYPRKMAQIKKSPLY